MIDRATVERIKNAANIVEVVSEFVTLRRSGANYKGLCPFHSEKTPSFIVSPARGTCHCFGCGRGGNAVSFIMEHEQYTYPEALRWLAAKYGIEIREKELSEQERQEQSEREAMFIVNEWASKYFENLLHDDADGQTMGMQYYRNRGFRDDIISKYRLGYDVRDRHALAHRAKKEGYKEEFLLKTGLCFQNERGELIDRFADRVVFPWLTISGKVVGFSARLLNMRTKGVNQKYVNSPDSEIFHKECEIFGIYQAKKSIAKENRVYMVEGQTDVLSMAQCGIENVVANSGTALSTHQITILHRLTDNITLLYDGDEAGLHATQRGIDMLLAEGMNVKVLIFPDGDDPDSFARKHTADKFREYIETNQLDFIQFKTRMMLHHVADPQQRTEAIDSIVRSISYVPNQVLRDTYLHDASTAVGMKETTLIMRMNNFIKERREGIHQSATPSTILVNPSEGGERTSQIEQMIMQLIVRYGEKVVMKDVENDNGVRQDLTLSQYIYHNLKTDHLQMKTPIYWAMLEDVAQHAADGHFVAEQYLINHEDINISRAALALTIDKYGHIPLLQYPKVADDVEESYEGESLINHLRREADHLLVDFRIDFVDEKMKDIKSRLSDPNTDANEKQILMREIASLQSTRRQLAGHVGLKVLLT